MQKSFNLKSEPIDRRAGYISPYSYVITETAIRPKNVESIVRNAVLEAFETQWTFINVKGRKSGLLMPRHAYFYFMRKMHNPAEYSLHRIGAIMKKHHSTVIHSVKVWENLKDTDDNFLKKHERIQKIIDNRLKNIHLNINGEAGETVANWKHFRRNYE
jgi:hypothetical protein